MISEILLPQTEPGAQRKYTFSYNSDRTAVPVDLEWYGACDAPANHITQASPGWGALSEAQFPSGATAKYTYSLTETHALISGNDLARERVTTKTLLHDNKTDTWTYGGGSTSPSSVAGPDGSVITEFGYPTDAGFLVNMAGPNGLGGLVYKTDYSGKKIVERRWIRKKFNGADDTITAAGAARFNPVVAEEYTTLVGNPSKMSAKVFQYDFNGNLTSETEYDWFDPALVTRDMDAAHLPTGVPSQLTPIRVTTYSYHNDASGAGSSNVYAKRVIGDPPTPLILNALKETIVGTAKVRLSYDGLPYATAQVKGNITTETHWDSSHNKWLDTVREYDTYGNVTKTTDPKGNQTTMVYDAATHAQPISITVDPLNGTDPQVTSFVYDYSTGLPTKQTDPNGHETGTDYTNQLLTTPAPDPFGRAGVVTSPALASTADGETHADQRRKVVMKYYDNARQVETISDLKQQSDGLLKSRTTADQLGRATLTETSENGSTYTIKQKTDYEQMGRIMFASNPTRDDGATTEGWTRTTRDDVGRVIEVTTFSGAAQPPTTGTNANWTGSVGTTYNAETTTVTDQAGKVRRSVSDSLGRLKQVIEDPAGANHQTSYNYDALDNLIHVTQGTQTRDFVYDSLSRLISAMNPESGTITYEYDDNGNLKKRTDSRIPAVITTYTYDGLDRIATRTYSDGTPAVTYSYDDEDVPNSIGRLTRVSSSVSVYDYLEYDAVGRVTRTKQTTGATEYTMSCGYDLAGNRTTETYPSGREVRTSFDSAGRIANVKGYIGSVLDKTYASSIAYASHGAVSVMQLGNGKWEHTNFNSRLQPLQIGLGTSSSNSSILKLDYAYNTTGQTNNNGNVRTQTITLPTGGSSTLTLTQNYSYDSLDRLSAAEEFIGTTSQWKQIYDSDRWGNRAVRSSSYMPNPQLTPQSATETDFSAFEQSKNRLKQATFPQVLYDGAGNLIRDMVGSTFAYDGENRQVTANVAGVTTSYDYDGDGRRVKKTTGSVTTVMVYNSAGQLIAEYRSDSAPPVGGGGTSYLTSDHLGSIRAVTKADGSVKARYDYLPYGEQIPSNIAGRAAISGYSGADSTRQKFTSKERDNESGLDYFTMRYYSSTQGRFTSPDEPFADQEEHDPQSWNLYTYVGNNPLLYTDSLGLFKEVVIDGKTYWQVEEGDSYFTLSKASGIPTEYLQQYFQNVVFHPGEFVDLTGFGAWYNRNYNRLVTHITSDQLPRDGWSIEITPSLPIPGGKVKRITALDTNKLIEVEKVGAKALKHVSGKLVVSKAAFSELVAGSTLAKVNALLRKYGIQKFFGVRNKAAFENALEQGLKLGLTPKDAVILATAKAQGTALITRDDKMINAAKEIGVKIAPW